MHPTPVYTECSQFPGAVLTFTYDPIPQTVNGGVGHATVLLPALPLRGLSSLETENHPATHHYA